MPCSVAGKSGYLSPLLYLQRRFTDKDGRSELIADVEIELSVATRGSVLRPGSVNIDPHWSHHPIFLRPKGIITPAEQALRQKRIEVHAQLNPPRIRRWRRLAQGDDTGRRGQIRREIKSPRASQRAEQEYHNREHDGFWGQVIHRLCRAIVFGCWLFLVSCGFPL